jgi:phosphomannomutase/phosphoglucomutase
MVEPENRKSFAALARRKKAPSTPAPEKPRRQRSPVATYTALAVLLALSLSLAVAYWGHQAWIKENRLSQLRALAREHVQVTAGAVKDVLQTYQNRLKQVAQAPEITAALQQRDAAGLQGAEQQLKQQIPTAIQAHALPSGTAITLSGAQSTLRFAEFDMVSRAEKGEQVPPEALNRDSEWQIVLVQRVPVETAEPAAGTLLVSLPTDVLRPALEKGNRDTGKIELRQSFNEHQNMLLLSTGQGDADKPQVVDIPGTYWQLHFTPSVQLFRQIHVDLLLPVVLWALFTIISLIAAVYGGRWLGQREARKRSPARHREAAGHDKTPATAGGYREPQDILDIEISDEDEALLGLEEGEEAFDTEPLDNPAMSPIAHTGIPEVIFRAYDIRGLADVEITPELAHLIGQALGSEALDSHQNALVVARDGRTHSPLLADHLINGILSTGCGVINLGAVPTPLMYFATETLPQTQSGVMVTASHNGPEYNGFKVVINGKSRSAEDIQNIRKRILTGDFYSGHGTEEHLDIAPHYIDTIFSDVALAGDIHVVIDAGNGITGQIAPRLFEELGCRVTPLFCELDGTFPNHAPDPSVSKNLRQLVARVKEESADVGVAFDGDGDRLTVVTSSGEIVWADRLLLLYAKDILARNPGADVVFDVKSTRLLNSAISSFGGRPVMWQTGHAPMRAKMHKTGALVGAEFSGHVFIKDRWYGFDDGIYAAARLLEIMTLRGEDLDTMLAEFPPTHITPETLIAVAEDQKFAIVRRLQEHGDFENARLTTLDGLRADFPYGWGLVRASNTSANLTLRFEADTEDDLRKIKALFARELNKVDSNIHFS